MAKKKKKKVGKAKAKKKTGGKKKAKGGVKAKTKAKVGKKAKGGGKGKIKIKAKSKAKPKAKTAAPKAAANMPDVGDEAPVFQLPTDANGPLDLAAYRGASPVVLYFYPKDDTPGCTTQACTFEQDLAHYEKAGVQLVGISPDPVVSHAKFRQKYGLSFPLVSDEGAVVAKRYGVWVLKNNYGKKYMGIQRSTFLIGKDGRVKAAWPKVKVDGHSAEVLAAIQGLGD